MLHNLIFQNNRKIKKKYQLIHHLLLIQHKYKVVIYDIKLNKSVKDFHRKYFIFIFFM